MKEIERRRTFAIISHPDAGKTTLTEKFLLFGGQIQVAGAVKNNKIRKTATSDWMDIEKQRGISVSTSVMEFDYLPDGEHGDPYKVNILDTPGHQDFAEDTYRTLTAVDSAIIVVDSAKGVEAQTRKLMEVCRMRNTPVIIFINKMDREGRDAFDVLDELEEELKIKVRPLSWPIGQGARFKGVYNIYEQQLNLFTPNKQRVTEKVEVDINSEALDQHVGEREAAQLREDLELVDGVYPAFDVETYRSAEVAPVFFGSALNNFGVQELLDCFVKIAPSPKPTQAEERLVEPEESKFTGFIFKITANIDPNHRSCIAFCKICSGKFVRNQPYLHVRLGKTVRFSSPTQFMAQRKSTIDEAYPGDIVGLPDNGIFMGYANREPRFYASVAYSGTVWPGLSTTEERYHYQQVFYYRGEADGRVNGNERWVNTGIGVMKYVHPYDILVGNYSEIRQKADPALRYADILLLYAEAVNNLTSSYDIPSWDGTQTYTVSRDIEQMRRGVKPVRMRAGVPDYSDGVYADRDKFFNAIVHERQVELFAENQRFFDLRRWKIAEKHEAEQIYGCNTLMDKRNALQFYNPVRVPKLQTSFSRRQYFWPISWEELRRNKNLTQAPGWRDYE